MTQPIRNRDSGSMQSLLGQTRCEKKEGPQQTAKVGEKGVRTEYHLQIFTPLSYFSRHLSLMHDLPAFHLVFIIFFCFAFLSLPVGKKCWKFNHAVVGKKKKFLDPTRFCNIMH